jgi:hypothetical protein
LIRNRRYPGPNKREMTRAEPESRSFHHSQSRVTARRKGRFLFCCPHLFSPSLLRQNHSRPHYDRGRSTKRAERTKHPNYRMCSSPSFHPTPLFGCGRRPFQLIPPVSTPPRSAKTIDPKAGMSRREGCDVTKVEPCRGDGRFVFGRRDEEEESRTDQRVEGL